MSLFDRFFRVDDDDTDDRIRQETAYAHEVAEFVSLAYYQRFLRWLEGEALKPVKVSSGQDMVISAARQNAFLEVREHLLREAKKAKARLENR